MDEKMSAVAEPPESEQTLEGYIASLHGRIDALEAQIAAAQHNMKTMMDVVAALGELVNYRLTPHQIAGGRVRLDWNPTGRIVL